MDATQIFEHALGLKLEFKQSLQDFAEIASNAYDEDRFTDEQMVVCLSKSVLLYESVQYMLSRMTLVTSKNYKNSYFNFVCHV